MATEVQLFAMFCEGILGVPATVAQQNAIAAAIVPNMPAEWTNTQRCVAVRKEVIRALRARRASQLDQASATTSRVANETQVNGEIPDV